MSAAKIWKVLKDGPFASREWTKGTFVSMTPAEAKPFKAAGYITPADALEYNQYMNRADEPPAVLASDSQEVQQMFEVPIAQAQQAAQQASATAKELNMSVDDSRAILENIRRERAAFKSDIAEISDVVTQLESRIEEINTQADKFGDTAGAGADLINDAKAAAIRAETAAKALGSSQHPVDVESNRRLNLLLGSNNQIDARLRLVELKVELSQLDEETDWSDAERARFSHITALIEEASNILIATAKLKKEPPTTPLNEDENWI